MKSGADTMKSALAMLLCLSAACASAAEGVKPFVRGSHQQIVSARVGKPFIVSFWSLTCTNCVDDLVLFGKLAKKYPDLGLVLVATDTPEQKQEIAKTLQRYRLQNKESWVFADSFVERLRYEVDPQWYGELPRTYFFDAQGVSIAISGKVERDQVEQWIKANARHK
jgi:thiol-disulfide isomerase/thioredoxin